METLRLKMTDITKTFPGVKALDRVQLNVKPGSVHALIGENGAGKSTLMKCLFGLYHADEGSIELDGEKVTIDGPTEALKQGISMIQQELTPIPYRNVIDNIWAGRFEKKGIVVDEAKMKKKTEDLLADLELNIPATVLAKDLSVSQLQAVEIAKAVSYDARIIIMDEPTSSLTNAETKHLFKIIRRLQSEGRSIIYISHKLEELFEIADEITVMRDGTYVGQYPIEDISVDELIKLMVGRSMENRFPPNEHVVQPDILLKVENFTSADSHSFKNVSFDLHKGEILGIGGLVGAQRTELVESVFGLRKIIEGKLYKNGKEIVTYGMASAVYGLNQLYFAKEPNNSQPIGGIRDDLTILSRFRIGGQVSFLVVIALVVMAIVWFILNRTTFGKNIYITGGNKEAAKVSGINVDKVIIACFIIESILVGLAGILEVARTGGANAGYGNAYEFDAISSCVVGGVSLSGGIGKVSGAFIGVMIFTFISYGLSFIGLNSNWQLVIKGIIICSAVALDMRKNAK